MISVDKLRRSYSDFNAVDNLSFAVKPGEILGLVGPNGAGKTTSLRVLAGILPATSGKVVLSGHSLDRDPMSAKKITGYVPDNPMLFDSLTVWEHLDFTATVYQVPSFEKSATELLARFDLLTKKDTAVHQLSLGMRQKLAICCACLYTPTVLIFDEPLTGLDPRGMASAKETIRERADDGCAVIISSHLLNLVEDICTHILIIDQGKALLSAPMDKLIDRQSRRQHSSPGSKESLESVFLRITGQSDGHEKNV